MCPAIGFTTPTFKSPRVLDPKWLSLRWPIKVACNQQQIGIPMVQTKLSGVTTLQQPTHLSPPRTPVGRAGGKRTAAHRLLERQRLQRPSHGEKCAFPENRCWRVCTLQDWENTNKSKHIYIYTSLSLSFSLLSIYPPFSLSLSLFLGLPSVPYSIWSGHDFHATFGNRKHKKAKWLPSEANWNCHSCIAWWGHPKCSAETMRVHSTCKSAFVLHIFPHWYVCIYIYGT